MLISMKSLLRERWSDIRPLFEHALDLSAAERAVWLQSATSDPALRDAVKALIAGEEELGAAESASDQHIEVLARPEHAALPAQLGRYQVLRELGRGGMGVVYLAEQASPRRQVAIKRLTVSADAFTRARFAREAQLLAQLSHPGIARVIELDIAQDGQPLLVMEYVQGESLAVAASQLQLEARLKLLAAIADAVEHAHARGIVHRDLKPSNILITADGQPKVLDFGIGRTVAGEGATLTETGMLLGTPAYMSPEQALGQAHVDARADVWALGVIGYELLANRLPLPVSGLTPLQALKVVSQDTPPPLSRLDARLRGDLEVLIGTALASDPASRYPTAGAFADDLRRYLAREPIRARRPAALKRLWLWARRKPALAAMSSATAIAIVLGSGVAGYQAQQARQEAARAQAAARTANAVSAAMQSLFKAASPDENGGAQLTVREALDLGAAEALNSLRQEPHVQHALRAELATSYENLGEYEKTVALLEPTPDAPKPSIEADVELRMELSLARAYARLDRHPQAEAIYRRWLPAVQANADRNAPLTTRRINDFWEDYSAFLRDQSEFARAHAAVDAWIARAESAQGTTSRAPTGAPLDADKDSALVRALREKAEIYYQEKRFAESIGVLEQARALASNAEDVSNLQRAQLAGLLGRALVQNGQPKTAQALLLESIDWHTRVLGANHPATFMPRLEIANQLAIAGDYQRARDEFLQIKRQIAERFGPEHIKNALVLHQLALLDYQQARYADAAHGFKAASGIFLTRLDPDHSRVLTAKSNLAGALSELGQASAALPIIDEVLSIRRMQGDNGAVASLLTTRGLVLEQLKRDAEAERSFAEARSLLGSDLANSAYAQTLQGRVLLRQGRPDAALQLLQPAADYYPTSEYGCGPRCAIASLETSRALFALNRDPSAQRHYAQIALKARREKLGADHALTLEAEQWLAGLESNRQTQQASGRDQ